MFDDFSTYYNVAYKIKANIIINSILLFYYTYIIEYSGV